MEHWLTEIMNEYGYMGILFLIALENIFPPIPSEVILSFAGFMTTNTSLSIAGVVFFSTLGSVMGAIVLFLVGLQLDVERLEKIVDRWGHILRITKKDVQKADAWFDKYGPWAVFFCRFIPLIRSLISVPAGMSNMNMAMFLLYTTLGTLLWNVALVYIGASVGSSWNLVVEYMEIYSRAVYFILFVLIMVFLFIFIKRKR